MSSYGKLNALQPGSSNSVSLILSCWPAVWTSPACDQLTYGSCFWQAGASVLTAMPGRQPQAAACCGVLVSERGRLAGSWLLVYNVLANH